MKQLDSPKTRIIGFYILLIAFCCAPIWAVEFFINQDGSAHLYSSYIMLELFRGNPQFAEVFAFNSISVPNSSGHWLMALLLNVFSPFAVTKIIVTLTFAALVAAVGWLRLATVGVEGVKTSLLLGAAVGFNWLWLCGFYNFLIGVSCFVFTTGLIFRWRDRMNLPRAVVLSSLFLLAYFSHIISFVILAGSAFSVLASAEKQNLKRNLLYFCGALLPVLPFAVLYKSISTSGGGFFPVWRNLANPFSPASWFSQIRAADPFILISRKTIPFTGADTRYFAVFTPFLWMLAAIVSLATATFCARDRTKPFSKEWLTFAFLFCPCVLAAFLAPDDFGLTNGSILRERLLICGLIFFVPLFRAENSIGFKRLAQICLGFVLVFQTAALWEYALKTNREAKEFLAAQNLLQKGDRIVSVVVIENGLRFNSTPAAQMNNYLGIEKSAVAWDNYEIGHYLFPVVAKHQADKQFVFELTQNTTFVLNDPNHNFDDRIARLGKILSENPAKINTLILWGKDPRVDAVLPEAFETVIENGRVRVYRQK